MIDLKEHGVGAGIYSVKEAARLAGVSVRRVRGWTLGYRSELNGGPTPVLPAELRESGEPPQLDFTHLLEIRVVNALLEKGLHWREIRRAAQVGTRLLNTPHPFVSEKFKTDGRKIFLELERSLQDPEITHLAENQQVFAAFIRPYLEDITFLRGEAVCWRPLGSRRTVIVDPKRCFGRPITESSGVPTSVLASFAAGASVRRTSHWYSVPAREVRDAIAFEKHLSSRAA